MSSIRSGVGGPRELPNHATQKPSAALPTAKKLATVGSGRVTDELLRSIPLLAIISLALLLRWTPQDVQGLAAVIIPALYFPGRGLGGI